MQWSELSRRKWTNKSTNLDFSNSTEYGIRAITHLALVPAEDCWRILPGGRRRKLRHAGQGAGNAAGNPRAQGTRAGHRSILRRRGADVPGTAFRSRRVAVLADGRRRRSGDDLLLERRARRHAHGSAGTRHDAPHRRMERCFSGGTNAESTNPLRIEKPTPQDEMGSSEGRIVPEPCAEA